jgi:hypothetical protein
MTPHPKEYHLDDSAMHYIWYNRQYTFPNKKTLFFSEQGFNKFH